MKGSSAAVCLMFNWTATRRAIAARSGEELRALTAESRDKSRDECSKCSLYFNCKRFFVGRRSDEGEEWMLGEEQSSVLLESDSIDLI